MGSHGAPAIAWVPARGSNTELPFVCLLAEGLSVCGGAGESEIFHLARSGTYDMVVFQSCGQPSRRLAESLRAQGTRVISDLCGSEEDTGT